MTVSGLRILDDLAGEGELVERGNLYDLRLRLWLNRGEPVRWDQPWGSIDRARLDDDGTTLVTRLRIDRENLVAGLFRGIEGMRIGGRRKLKISPHLAYGDRGIPGKIPPDAVIVAEIEILAKVTTENNP